MECQDEQRKNAVSLELLTPSKVAENAEIYNPLLRAAILNPDVYNIALTGSYGSGKSSVINTFLKNEGKEFETIRISLADFSFESGKENPKPRTVEIDLLQQILFQTKDWAKNGPAKGIENISPNWRMWVVILLAVVSTLSYLVLYRSESLIEWFFSQKPQDFSFSKTVNYIAGSLIIISFSWIAYNIYIILKRIKLKRVHVKSLALELANEESRDSLINKYLMELVKLFKHEKKNLVILEDIDRLKDHSLFLDLRKLNTILNLNPDIEKKVTFVYAIRDSVFKDEKDKTKFFDLIIPIVPYLSIYSSKNKFLELMEKTGVEELNEGIKDVIVITSLRIEEMRTIINITNEFKVYQSVKRKEGIKDEKLLAIMVYKNLFPIDFERAIGGWSDLHKAFESKKSTFENRRRFLKGDMERTGITEAEKEKNKREIEELEKLLKGLDSVTFSTTFKYNPRFGEVLTFNLEGKRDSKGEFKLNEQGIEKRKLLVSLIKREYISSDFMYYISLLHKGFLTDNDISFLKSVKDGRPLEFSYKLDSPKEVYADLIPLDWKSKGILNFDLFNHCLSKKVVLENIINVYSSFKDEADRGCQFVIGFFSYSRNKKLGIFYVVHYWLTFIDDAVRLQYNIDELLPYFLINDPDVLEIQNENNALTEVIDNTPDFISLFEYFKFTKLELKDFEKNLERLAVQVVNLKIGSNLVAFDAVYNASAYEISAENLLSIFKRFEIEIPLSYSALQSLKLNPLKLYIEDGNLDFFIVEVLDTYYAEKPAFRWKEDKKSVVHLLNLDEEQLSIASKKILIKRADFDKVDFSEISDKTLWEPLCVSKKINSKWKNLRDYFIQKDNKEISEDSGLLVLVNDASWIKDLPQLVNDSATIAKYDALITSLIYFEFEKPIGLKRFLKKLDFLLDQKNINENSDPVNIRTVIEGDFFDKTLEVYKKLKEVALTDILHLEYAKKIQDLLLNDDSLFEFSTKELTYILNENFKLDFKYKALLRNPNHIQGLDGKTVTKAFGVILKKGDYSSLELMKQLMIAVAMEYQVKLFNQIYKERAKLGYKVTDLMNVFKGELKHLGRPLKRIKMERNEDTHQFALNLVSLGLVTTYNENDKEVRFSRNTIKI